MAELFAWATAELEFELRDQQGAIPEGILDGMEEAVVTIAQGGTVIEKRASDGSVGVDAPSAVLRVHLSQQETAKLKGGTKASPKSADAQVNIYYGDERRNATYESRIAVFRNLHPKRMP